MLNTLSSVVYLIEKDLGRRLESPMCKLGAQILGFDQGSLVHKINFLNSYKNISSSLRHKYEF